MAIAEGKSSRRVANLIGSPEPTCQGMRGSGGRRGIPCTITPSISVEKREPMVATSKEGQRWCASTAATAASGSATSGAGTFLVRRGSTISTARVSAPMITSWRSMVRRACTYDQTRSTKWSGFRVGCRPRKSFSCRTPMTVPMPAVKPVVTGCGMNWIRRPRRKRPIATRSTPAIPPATNRPSRPWRTRMGARITTNAAVGPLTWKREPPRTATTRPATIAV